MVIVSTQFFGIVLFICEMKSLKWKPQENNIKNVLRLKYLPKIHKFIGKGQWRSQDFFEGGDNLNFSYIKKALFEALKYLV